MRSFVTLLLVIGAGNASLAQETKERFFGKFIESKLKKYATGYDKKRIVTTKGAIVGIFTIKPNKDAAQRDWGMVVRLQVGTQLPLVYLGTYGALDNKTKPLTILENIIVRGSLTSANRIVADTIWRKGKKISIRTAEIDRTSRDPFAKKFSWQKPQTIRGQVTRTRQLVPLGSHTGVYVRLGINRWCYLGSAEYLIEQHVNPSATKTYTITGKWVKGTTHNVLVAGKIKIGKREVPVRDRNGKLIQASEPGTKRRAG